MSQYDFLVNKDNPIKKEQLPQNLKIVGPNLYPLEGLENKDDYIKLESVAAINFLKMLNEANNIFDTKIIADSGFRSIERQQEILDFYLQPNQMGNDAYNLVAIPGQSEHHTGLAIDIALIKNGIYTDKITGEEPEIIWLHNNCHRFGFILRYPKNKEKITGYDYEPWHFRYVGKPTAEFITFNNITLEEYHKNISLFR